MKKVISVMLSLLVVLGLNVHVDAVSQPCEEHRQYVDDEKTSTSSVTSDSGAEIIVSKNADGSISTKEYNYSVETQTRHSEEEKVLDEYVPTNNSALAGSRAVVIDEYGRSPFSPADPRVGYLLCGFDSDNDGDADEYRYGTASLQHYDIVITAAHCVWKKQYADYDCGGWAVEIKFYAGRESSTTYLSMAEYSTASISMNFVNNTEVYLKDDGTYGSSIDANYDWCILKFNQNLGGQYGWFGLHGCGTPEIGISVATKGYPSDKTGYEQWCSLGTISAIDGNIAKYSAYTVGGNSGGPVYKNGYVYGIHSCAYYDSAGDMLCAGATRMYDALFEIISDEREASAERWEG